MLQRFRLDAFSPNNYPYCFILSPGVESCILPVLMGKRKEERNKSYRRGTPLPAANLNLNRSIQILKEEKENVPLVFFHKEKDKFLTE